MDSDIFTAVNFVKNKLHKIVGLWPNQNPTLRTEARTLVSFILAASFFVTNLMEIILHFSNFKDLAENLSVTAPVLTMLLKISVFETKRGKFFKMLDLLKNSDIFHPKVERYSRITQTMNQNCILLIKMYSGICTVVVMFQAVLSQISDSDLPIKFTYDFGSWIYGMYFFQISAIVNVCFTTVCLDTLVVCLMGMVIAQLEVVEQKILDLYNEDMCNLEGAKIWLDDCVFHHSKIIEFILAFEDIFNLFFLAQYLGSIFAICNIGFQVANVRPGSVEFFTMVCFFSAMFWQLATFCWFGNEIILKSLSISDACYQTDWLKSDDKNKKSLLIIMTRASRQLAVSAGKFSILSLESLTSIMNVSYSYFALMQKLYQDEQE